MKTQIKQFYALPLFNLPAPAAQGDAVAAAAGTQITLETDVFRPELRFVNVQEFRSSGFKVGGKVIQWNQDIPWDPRVINASGGLIGLPVYFQGKNYIARGIEIQSFPANIFCGSAVGPLNRCFMGMYGWAVRDATSGSGSGVGCSADGGMVDSALLKIPFELPR